MAASSRKPGLRIIPVLDVLNGVVVRGIAGDRANYRPLLSQRVASCDPLTVAESLRPWCTAGVLYVADLDGILQREPHWNLYAQLAAAGFETWIDAGCTTVEELQRLLEIPRIRWIAGLESLAAPQALAALVENIPPDRIVFSLDLKSGVLLVPQTDETTGWAKQPLGIVEQVTALGIQRVIVLDLADVGTGGGGSTFALCQQLRARFPELELIAGGGVRGPADLERWREVGAWGVLVASAIHDGRLGTGAATG